MAEHAFSVLVIAHGRAGHLCRLLAGVDRSRARPVEVVLVYMDEPEPPHVRCAVPLVIRHVSTRPGEAGLPLARARNAAAAAASSANLVFLDVDCIPDAALFGSLVDAIGQGPVLAMAEPRYLPAPLDAGREVEDGGLLAASVAHHARTGLAGGGSEGSHEMFWSLGFAIEAGLFAQLGGFDEEFTGYGAEDTDFAFRARAAGIPMRFVQDTLFHQHHGVHKPPLNHFDAIITNARLFQTRWGRWPMEGWLGAFTELGLLDWTPDHSSIIVLSAPTPAQIEDALSEDPY